MEVDDPPDPMADEASEVVVPDVAVPEVDTPEETVPAQPSHAEAQAPSSPQLRWPFSPPGQVHSVCSPEEHSSSPAVPLVVHPVSDPVARTVHAETITAAFPARVFVSASQQLRAFIRLLSVVARLVFM